MARGFGLQYALDQPYRIRRDALPPRNERSRGWMDRHPPSTVRPFLDRYTALAMLEPGQRLIVGIRVDVHFCPLRYALLRAELVCGAPQRPARRVGIGPCPKC